MKRIILLISTLLLCFVFASCDFTEIESDNTTVPSNADVGEPSNTTEAPQPTAPTDTENITDTAPEEKLDKSIMDQIYEGMPQEELEKIIPKEQWLDDRYGYYRYIFSDGTSIRFRFEPMRPSKDSPEDTEYSGLSYLEYIDFTSCTILGEATYNKEGKFYYIEESPESTDTNTVS